MLALEEAKQELTSDADGRLTVPIAAAGLHILRAKVTRPDGANGELNRLAVLAFRIRP